MHEYSRTDFACVLVTPVSFTRPALAGIISVLRN